MACHRLYRFYRADGVLLYVGRTINPGSRMGSHRVEKHWWPDVAYTEFEPFETAGDLAKAEASAIKREKPLFNLAGRWRSLKRFRQKALVAKGWHLTHDLVEGKRRNWGTDIWSHRRYYETDSSYPYHPAGAPGVNADSRTAYRIEFGTIEMCEEAVRAAQERGAD